MEPKTCTLSKNSPYKANTFGLASCITDRIQQQQLHLKDFLTNQPPGNGVMMRALVENHLRQNNPQIMQPYEEKISETSSYKGNETLEPVKFYSLSIDYTYSKTNFTISPNLFFQKYKGYWEEVTYETGEKVNGISKLITTPENAGDLNYYGANITSTLKVNNVLNFTSNIYLVNFDRTGTFETINMANQTIVKNFNNSNWTGSASLLTQIKINNLFDLQVNAKHRLKSEDLYFSRKARTYASLAINKDIFEKEASISLTIDDLFLSNTTNRDRFDTNYFSKSFIENKHRTILLSFTYRFNQSKKDRRIDFDKKDFIPKY